MGLSVAPSDPFTIGIEEELFLVEPHDYMLSPNAAEVLSRLGANGGRVGHEAYASEVELRSHPSRSATEAAEELAALRREAGDAGATLLGAGLHPAAEFGVVELVDLERYRTVRVEMRGLSERTP